jgi:hypothetical protein
MRPLLMLHAELGIELSQTLFVGPNVLLVEGPCDVLYLEVFSEALKGRGREGLDGRLAVTPAGGIAKLPAFVTLLGANKLNTIVLVDSSNGEHATVKRSTSDDHSWREALHSRGLHAVNISPGWLGVTRSWSIES